MKNPSDEELVNNITFEIIRHPVGCSCDWCVELQNKIDNLNDRLKRGRKVIEAMEKIAKARLEDDYDEFAAAVDLILRKYQQSCKEATDEN